VSEETLQAILRVRCVVSAGSPDPVLFAVADWIKSTIARSLSPSAGAITQENLQFEERLAHARPLQFNIGTARHPPPAAHPRSKHCSKLEV
jgi:hypothetical protein